MSFLSFDIIDGVCVCVWLQIVDTFTPEYLEFKFEMISFKTSSTCGPMQRLFTIGHNGHCFNQINHLSISLYAIQNTIYFDGCCCIKIVVHFISLNPFQIVYRQWIVNDSMGISILKTRNYRTFLVYLYDVKFVVIWPVTSKLLEFNVKIHNIRNLNISRSQLCPVNKLHCGSFLRDGHTVNVIKI